MNEPEHEKEFDQLLKKKSEGFELEPSGDVWVNVEAALKQNRKKKFFWWSIAALIFSVIASGFYFFLQNGPSTISTASLQHSSVDEKTQPSITHSSELGETNSAVKQNPIQKEFPVTTRNNLALKASSSSTPEITLNNKEVNGERTRYEEQSSLTSNERKADEILLLNSKSLSPLPNEESEKLRSHANAAANGAFSTSHSEEMVSHHFAAEFDAVPAVCFSWNSENVQSSSLSAHSTSMIQPTSDNSFWENGFSAGGNFFFNLDNLWLLGGGIHFTSTITKIAYATQTGIQLDTLYGNNTTVAAVDTMYLEYVPTEKFSQHWIDFSVVAGVQLFAASQNHFRILGGAAYSLLINFQSQIESGAFPFTFDVVSTGAGTNFMNPNSSSPALSKNQFQLLAEAAYVRDLGAHFHVSAGAQFHYYPFNLFEDNSIHQRLLWLGAKFGLQYSF